MDGEGWSGVVMDCGNDSTYKIVIYVMILEYVHISYQNFACLMTCLGISLRGCNSDASACVGKTHICGMMSQYNMSAILKSVDVLPSSWIVVELYS